MIPCNICPRQCDAHRDSENGNGYCQMGSGMRIARIAPHMWEEPCISGSHGSGTIFFSGCSLRCAYCQNGEISHHSRGRLYSEVQLSDAIRALEAEGVHNINFVTPTHYTREILRTLRLYKPSIPVVWNTGGYELSSTISSLAGKVDIYLTDLKHYSDKMGALCAGAPDYFAHASEALKEMCHLVGTPWYDERGIMKKGVIVRHLVLPGLTLESMRILDWIAMNLPAGIPVSLMRQYVPLNGVSIPGLTRRITDREYERVARHMSELRLPGLLQEREAASSAYVPLFSDE